MSVWFIFNCNVILFYVSIIFKKSRVLLSSSNVEIQITQIPIAKVAGIFFPDPVLFLREKI